MYKVMSKESNDLSMLFEYFAGGEFWLCTIEKEDGPQYIVSYDGLEDIMLKATKEAGSRIQI